MPRSHWAGQLPVDLHDTLDALRFKDEGDSELCNRLILGLIDWITIDRIAAVSQGVLAISLAHVQHPEVLADYLRPALVHSIGEPSRAFEVRGDLREFCYEHPRILVLGRLPKNRKFLQFKAVEAVDQFLKGLELALPDTKTMRFEVALRWATQAPRAEEWADATEFFDWICQAYGLKEFPLLECLNSAPPRASRDTLIKFLVDLEVDGRIETGWSNGVRTFNVSLGEHVVNAYDLRDILASKNHPNYSRVVGPALRGERVQVLWRSVPIGFLVSGLDGQLEADYLIDLAKFFSQCPKKKKKKAAESKDGTVGEGPKTKQSSLGQAAFFKEFSKAADALREGTVGGVTIKTRQKDTLMLVSFSTLQPLWAAELAQAKTPCTTV